MALEQERDTMSKRIAALFYENDKVIFIYFQ